MRVRGLKLLILHVTEIERGVAPHAGAWIETQNAKKQYDLLDVAPHAGAWIETLMSNKSLAPLQRRTPCGCVD